MIVELEQGSEEWLNFRRTKIGASDAPIIMGVSPFKTAKQLYEEKVFGVVHTEMNYGMRRGKRLEPFVLSMLNQELEIDLVPVVMQSDEMPFLIASLDGYEKNKNLICEIKCPNLEDHDLIYHGKVPDHYYPQLQHIMYVSKHNSMMFVSYSEKAEEKLIYITVDAHEEYQKHLIEKEKIFYRSLCMEVLDPMFDSTVQRPDIDTLYYAYKDLREDIKKLEDKAEQIKQQIISLCEDKTVITEKVSITKNSRVSYDYDRLCKDLGVDKILYSKKTNYWSIKERS